MSDVQSLLGSFLFSWRGGKGSFPDTGGAFFALESLLSAVVDPLLNGQVEIGRKPLHSNVA